MPSPKGRYARQAPYRIKTGHRHRFCRMQQGGMPPRGSRLCTHTKLIVCIHQGNDRAENYRQPEPGSEGRLARRQCIHPICLYNHRRHSYERYCALEGRSYESKQQTS